MTRTHRGMVRIIISILGIVSALIAAAYLLFTGPHDIARYPPREKSLYRLPWPAGITWWCCQSNRGSLGSHRGWEEFAYDFCMPEGSDVCAARGGIVSRVDDTYDGHGPNMPNNLIFIDHGDGTKSWYLHLQKGGSFVKVGDRVVQGQIIARSGHVGRSMKPHLHFHVFDSERNATVPVRFADVNVHDGIPRMFFRYTSGNTVPK
jgi:murein DD-endopeptidase MepM/ murein hydrolase activator NlpD